LPHLPIEVLRGRLRRANELGLDYRTYAGIRATTGRDIIAVLFSSNALELCRGQMQLRHAVRQKLEVMAVDRRGLATIPVQPDDMLAAAPLSAAFVAPAAFASFTPNVRPCGRHWAYCPAIRRLWGRDRVVQRRAPCRICSCRKFIFAIVL
jgi:hypothetical protein